MAHSIIISKAENGFIVEAVGVNGCLLIATRKNLSSLVGDLASDLVVPKQQPDEEPPQKTPPTDEGLSAPDEMLPPSGADDSEEEEYL